MNLQVFPHKYPALSGREVVEAAELVIAELLVECRGLEGERAEIDVFAGPGDSLGLDTKSKVRTIALLFMDGDPKAMSFADVFGPDAKAYPKKNGSIYKMVRYPAAGYWVSYSLTNPTKNAMTVVTMRKMVKR